MAFIKNYDFDEELELADIIERIGHYEIGSVLTGGNAVSLLDAAKDIRWLVETVKMLLNEKKEEMVLYYEDDNEPIIH